MPRPDIPDLSDVLALPCWLHKTIPAAFEDINGHMNVQHYLGIYDEAGEEFFRRMGMDAAYVTREGSGIFDLEHHLHYIAEVYVGDNVAVHSRMLARTDKRLHGMWFLVNETRSTLASTFEFISAHIDLSARRTSHFPEDVATALDAIISEHATLSWAPPVCGVMQA